MCLCVCSLETPLTLAVQCEPGGGEAIRVLVDGGAHIDFRAKDGLTPLHKAVRGHHHTALLVNICIMLESFHTAICLWKVMILHVLCNKKRKNINLEQGVYLARWIFALKVTLYSLHLRCCISKQAKARTKRPSHSAIHTHPHTICKQITLLFDSAREKERR